MANHTCPIWVGYLLASPVRKLMENPEKILNNHVKAGMTALDAGSAMGFFSLPLAKKVGTEGRVICVDLQQKMLDRLIKRASKAGVADIIETRAASPESLNIKNEKERIDLALAIHIVHEVNSRENFFSEIYDALKSKGTLLFSEPAGHVSKDDFKSSLTIAEHAGFEISRESEKKRSRFAVLIKK